MMKIFLNKLLPLFIIIIAATNANAQQVPLDAAVQNRLNELTLAADTSINTGFRSVNWLELKPYLQNRGTDLMDSVFGTSISNANYGFKNITRDNWIKLSGTKHVFTIDPYIDLAAGHTNEGEGGKIINAVGGLQFQGVYNDRLSYSFGFASGYREYPKYITSYILDNQELSTGFRKRSYSR
jgi:hypothetical protein